MTLDVAKKRPAGQDKSHAPHKKPKLHGKPGTFKPSGKFISLAKYF